MWSRIRSAIRSLTHRTFESLPPASAISIQFYLRHKQWPRLNPPRTFSEWIQVRKLYERDPRFSRLADKIAVKEYVAAAIGEQYVIPTLWTGSSLPSREERTWPLPFVLKASHGSGQNCFVRTEEERNWDWIETLASQWLTKEHAQFANEWLYSQIPPSLLVEPYLGRGAVLPLDYKFFVFDGRVEAIQVDTGRATHHRRCFYDKQWKRMPFALEYTLETREIPRPACLDEMVELAQKLGGGFVFVRVDLYEIDGRPVFGEMTFYPGSGLEIFTPRHYDLHFGRLWSAACNSMK